MFTFSFYKNYPFTRNGERVPWVLEGDSFGDEFSCRTNSTQLSQEGEDSYRQEFTINSSTLY